MPTPAQFNIEEHLGKRRENSDFFMVEFGFNRYPAAFCPAISFLGRRAYAGFETFFRTNGDKPEDILGPHIKLRGSKNIFFLDMLTGSKKIADEQKAAALGYEGGSYLEGPYRVHTPLPDEVVDEVYASDVISDEHVSHLLENTEALVAESARIAKPGALFVRRETQTPNNTPHLSPELLAAYGISEVLRVDFRTRPGLFHRVEREYFPLYDIYNYGIDASSYYSFAIKA